MSERNTELPTSQTADLINTVDGNSSTPATQVSETPPEPSLECPTREFLDKNFRKPDLQKRCRELGITSIWTSKNNLIDMILNKSPPSSSDFEATQQNTSPSDDTQPPSTHSEAEHTPPHDGFTEMNMHDITKSIKTITSKLEVKDMEIELLNTEIKTAYATIELLQKRVTELEQKNINEEQHASVENSIPSSTTLLLGDTNLRHILCSDLEKNCQIKTILGANMDLLRS